MIAADLIPESLLSQVVAVFGPRRVILVGSRARGDARKDSDYDLVVVLDDGVPDELLSARRRYDGRRGLGVPAGHYSLPRERLERAGGGDRLVRSHRAH